MFDQPSEHMNGNGIAVSARRLAPATGERGGRRLAAFDFRVSEADRAATLEYSDCVSRNYSSSEPLQQTPQQARTCSTQVGDGKAPRAQARRPASPDANTVLNGRGCRPSIGLPDFPECFALLRADECFGWPR
jgi:hypothetical protein